MWKNNGFVKCMLIKCGFFRCKKYLLEKIKYLSLPLLVAFELVNIRNVK